MRFFLKGGFACRPVSDDISSTTRAKQPKPMFAWLLAASLTLVSSVGLADPMPPT
ncbi:MULTISPECIES: hypothetical protein [Halomonadaceae]|uniref:hypothetical protein n=1 Tax=Halomonadaceae TaxID=28256 RepID=UPI0015981375|nr:MULTISPECIES: hypothetical protein [Halomonas]QJQ96117.1 hypothetical protein HIO72_13140 [Halomonas sp. PA5]